MGGDLTRGFIFDFDGTLVDSKKAIYECMQLVTKKLAPNRIENAKKILIGPPLLETVSKLLGPEYQNLQDEFVKKFIEIHDANVVKHTKPYPDVEIVLQKLHEKKIPLAIATNKRLSPTKKLIDFFGWNKYFQFIECSDSMTKMRNKKEMIQAIINKNEIYRNSYFVGDTVNDGLSANNKKLLFIKACYGYGFNQDWTIVETYQQINHFVQILEITYKN
jgi:phosphoglycolate phosphatase